MFHCFNFLSVTHFIGSSTFLMLLSFFLALFSFAFKLSDIIKEYFHKPSLINKYFQSRSPSYEIELTLKDGSKTSIKAVDREITEEELENFFKVIKGEDSHEQ